MVVAFSFNDHIESERDKVPSRLVHVKMTTSTTTKERTLDEYEKKMNERS